LWGLLFGREIGRIERRISMNVDDALKDLKTLYGKRAGCANPKCLVCRANRELFTRLVMYIREKG